jgi:hypothetical protein
MKRENDNERFNSRAFVSIGTFVFFICLAVSGIMLQATDHQPYTFGKVYWTVMHNFAAIAFLIFALGHIGRNWKALKNYITKAKSTDNSKEMFAGLLIFTVIVSGCWILSKLLMQHHNIP